MNKELLQVFKENDYFDVRFIEGVGYCALQRFIFTVGLVVNIDPVGYEGRYCFKHLADARESLLAWDGLDDPKGEWIKYKGAKGEYGQRGISFISTSKGEIIKQA